MPYSIIKSTNGLGIPIDGNWCTTTSLFMSPGNKINWFTQCVLVGAVEVLFGLFFPFFYLGIDWLGRALGVGSGKRGGMICDMALIERVLDARKSFRSINALRWGAHSIKHKCSSQWQCVNTICGAPFSGTIYQFHHFSSSAFHFYLIRRRRQLVNIVVVVVVAFRSIAVNTRHLRKGQLSLSVSFFCSFYSCSFVADLD